MDFSFFRKMLIENLIVIYHRVPFPLFYSNLKIFRKKIDHETKKVFKIRIFKIIRRTRFITRDDRRVSTNRRATKRVEGIPPWLQRRNNKFDQVSSYYQPNDASCVKIVGPWRVLREGRQPGGWDEGARRSARSKSNTLVISRFMDPGQRR